MKKDTCTFKNDLKMKTWGAEEFEQPNKEGGYKHSKIHTNYTLSS